MARLGLLLRAYFFRALQRIATSLDLSWSHPLPPSHNFTRKIPCTVGRHQGKIKLLFYTPAVYRKSNPAFKISRGHPILVNFHGGGYVLGNAHDDARWATTVTQKTNAVVVSVDYRRAPEYPFPTGIEDCVSAVLWLWEHAEELGLDAERTAFSGFSAGGNFTYSVAIRLHEELVKMRKVGEDVKGRLVALASFYPSVDQTQTRAERDASNPNVIPILPAFLLRLFDEAYLYPIPKNMAHPLLSPGLASSEVLKAAFPNNMILITCGGDTLLAEAEVFRGRLKGLGMRVDGYVVEGVSHAWDKHPSFRKGNETREKAYEVATKSLKEVLGVGDE